MLRSVGVAIAFVIAGSLAATDTTAIRSKRLVLTKWCGGALFGDHWSSRISSTEVSGSEPHLLQDDVAYEHLGRWARERHCDLYSYWIEGEREQWIGLGYAVTSTLQWSMRIGPSLEVFAGWWKLIGERSLNYWAIKILAFSQGYAAAISYSIPISEKFMRLWKPGG